MVHLSVPPSLPYFWFPMPLCYSLFIHQMPSDLSALVPAPATSPAINSFPSSELPRLSLISHTHHIYQPSPLLLCQIVTVFLDLLPALSLWTLQLCCSSDSLPAMFLWTSWLCHSALILFLPACLPTSKPSLKATF